MQLAVYQSRTGTMLADWSGIAEDVVFGTNEHGDATLTAHISMPSVLAFFWLDRPGLPWIEVNENGMVVWRGRLEDVRLVTDGIEITALGAWSVFGDVPYIDTPFSPTDTDVIVADILGAARIDNPDLLSDNGTDIQSTGISAYDEDYTDTDMRQILTRFALLGSTASDPLRWEVGVGTDERLFFRPRGSAGQTWYVDAAAIDIERSLSRVWNSAYTRYASGTSTTATTNDIASITRYGAVRRRAYSSRTTDLTQAEQERDAVLADGATPSPRASLVTDQVFTPTGGRVPLWMVRSGDTVIVRNLPPEAGATVDRIRTFIIAETRFSCDTTTLDITPEAPLPRLDVQVARSLEVLA